jgi:hypothetical protein
MLNIRSKFAAAVSLIKFIALVAMDLVTLIGEFVEDQIHI